MGLALLVLAQPAVAADLDLAGLAPTIDAISYARVSAEAGDAAVLAALGQAVGRESQLVAVRASPFARAPEMMLPSLVRLACGRDPSLAPEAAQSLYAIAERLTASELSAREVLFADLAQADAAVGAGCQQPPSPDVTYALESTRLRLKELHR